jgi:hypothetical protein
MDDMYSMLNNRVKHLSNKRKDKEYLMLMEHFNKKFYESCDKCSYREYSNNLIALSKPLQNDFKNIKFKKFRKSPKRDDNIITNFLYNICYDGIKQIHYPIYLINALIKIFNTTTFHHYINKFDCITDDNKIAKTDIYAVNPLGIEILPNDKPMNFNNIKTYSFQYPNDKPKLITDYRVTNIYYYNTKYLYSAFYHNDNCYLYRIRVDKIYLLDNNVLPFKDIFCILFYEDKLIRELLKNNNLLLELKIQVVNVGKDGNKYVKKLDYKKSKKEQHKHLLLPDIINKSLKEVYIVNENGINLFDKSSLTDTELNELFNPKSVESVETATHSVNDATHSVNNDKVIKETALNSVICKDVIDYSSDDNSDEELSIESVETATHSVNDATHSVNNDEPQYVFSYNKFIQFTDYDKDIIERSIYNKLKDNDKMRLLFKPYNTINIIKNIYKSYSKQTYFNVILFNTDNKTLSNQYHIYLGDDNNIKSITEINNILD